MPSLKEAPSVREHFSGVSFALNHLQPLEAVGAAPAVCGPGPESFSQTCSSDFCASGAEPRLRAQGRTQACLPGASRSPLSPSSWGLGERQPQGKVGGSEGVGLGLTVKMRSAYLGKRPLLSLCFLELWGSWCRARGLEEQGMYFQLRLRRGEFSVTTRKTTAPKCDDN